MQTAMTTIDIYSVKLVKEKTGLYVVDESNLSSPDVVNEVIQTVLDLQSEAVEKFGIITLTTKHNIAGIHIISVGSLNSAIVHPREVFKAAILNNAAAFICWHNHPSGHCEASEEDIELTTRLYEVRKLMGIPLVDYIITGEDRRYFSFRENQLLLCE